MTDTVGVVKFKLHLFDLLWIVVNLLWIYFTTNPQQSTTNRNKWSLTFTECDNIPQR